MNSLITAAPQPIKETVQVGEELIIVIKKK